jgi:hypothetical protein
MQKPFRPAAISIPNLDNLLPSCAPAFSAFSLDLMLGRLSLSAEKENSLHLSFVEQNPHPAETLVIRVIVY